MSKKNFLLTCSITTMVLSLGLFSFLFTYKGDASQMFLIFSLSMMGVLTSVLYYTGFQEWKRQEKEGEAQ